MRLLVTGGAGFIGSCFVRHILNKYPSYQVVNLDALTYCGNIQNLDDIKENPNYTFIHGNICDKNLVREIISGVDCVVNFAAESHVDNSIKNPGIFIETNVQGTLNLLQASYEAKIERFLQVSTDEVYGTLGKTGYIYETTPLAPNSPYSASKAGMIGLAKSVAQELGSRGIRANAIAPGFIITDMTAKLPEEVREEWNKKIPLRRGGTTEDVANVATFLASDLSAYVSGQVIQVDGGMNM